MGWPPALREVKELLYEVYLAAGAPSLDEITGDIAADDGLDGAPSRDTVHRIITDGERSGQQADVVAVATVLARRAIWDAQDLAGRVRELWVRAQMTRGAGRPVGDFCGDVRLVLNGGLGVHPVLDIDDARNRFGILPAYVPRDHDARLKTVVDAAKAGRSGIAILVGRSSTGKTRALWEAVSALPDTWRLWHPLSPTAPNAALAELRDIAPRTVVWLNEAQHYLGPDPLGERVAAGLRQLLHDPLRAPVLVLGTLWPEDWDALTTSDRHAGARELFGGHKIDVPDAFTPAHLTGLDTADDADPRLMQAVQRADDGQVTQYLAGAPVLLERYNAARGATLALIHAAMDARRLGAGLHIPLDWLADAAPGYLTDTEYHALDSDWLGKALAYVTAPCNGIPGILTPINTTGPRNQRTRRPAANGTPADRPAPDPQGPRYMLADYLDQHGRHHRAQTIPPIDFWTAAAHHAHPTDMTALGNAAWDRGLYRDAAQLHKHATAYGTPDAAGTLVNHLRILHPTDHRPAQWAAAHVALDNPSEVALLLMELREVGADEQVGALLARDPAAHTALNAPIYVAWLLRALREVGADEQVATLAQRAAAHVTLNDPYDATWLLQELRDVGADEQVATLAERAAYVTLDNLPDVTRLLKKLREIGADEQVATLAERAAAYVALDNPSEVALLLMELREVGADEQVGALLARDPTAHTTFNNPDVAAELLRALREVGADEQVAALAQRAAEHVALDAPFAVARLLNRLREVGADEQVATLAQRAAAHVALNDPYGSALLLRAQREVGADEQVRVLLARNPAAHVALDHPHEVALLLEELRKVGADEQVRVLLARDPAAHTALNRPYEVALLLEELKEVGADEQIATLAPRAAAHVAPNPYDVAELLRAMRGVGADEQIATLALRVAAHVALDAPYDVARLLTELREVGADEQVRVLLARDPAAHTALNHPYDVALLLMELREAGADEQVVKLAMRAAAHVAPDALDDPTDVAGLLSGLREAGADEQATILAKRLPAVGHFALFITHGGNREQFRLGREPNGSAATSWTWDDMD
ncbi:hypothetical protein [Streptomyces cyaneofuscatus]|uniref:hypothetical protein n=1 Tax=Streptomyces cyaneofuscatus TaxID=66883 RepID=UPI003796AA88